MSGTSDKSPVYQLYGVVVHLDIMNAAFSGHYVCYVRNFQNKWYKVDDSSVCHPKLVLAIQILKLMFYASPFYLLNFSHSLDFFFFHFWTCWVLVSLLGIRHLLTKWLPLFLLGTTKSASDVR